MAAGAWIYGEIIWLYVAWRNEKWAAWIRNLLNILAEKLSGPIYEKYRVIFLQAHLWVWFYICALWRAALGEICTVPIPSEKWWGVSVFIQPDGVLGGLPNAIRWMLVLFCSRPSWAGGYGGSKGWFWEHRALESAVEGTGDELKDGAVWDPKGDQESFYSAFGLA